MSFEYQNMFDALHDDIDLQEEMRTLQKEVLNEPNNTTDFLNGAFDDPNYFTYAGSENFFSNEFFNAINEVAFNDPSIEPADDLFINALFESTLEDVFTTNQLNEAAQRGNDESISTLPSNCGLNVVEEKNDSKINSRDIPNHSAEENTHLYCGLEIGNEVTMETEQPENEILENELKSATEPIQEKVLQAEFKMHEVILEQDVLDESEEYLIQESFESSYVEELIEEIVYPTDVKPIEPIQETVFQAKSKMHEVILEQDVLEESEEPRIQESFDSICVEEPIEKVIYVTDDKPEEILIVDSIIAVINENSDILNSPIKCPIDKCGKTFTQLSSFKIHIQSHNESRKFKCPISNCPMSFKQKINLDSHVRTHTGLKPFKCSYRNKSLTQQGNMKTHERKHISSDNGHENCKFCEEKFINRDDLHKHMQNHKPLQCLDCEDQFKRALDLRTHVENIHKHKTRTYHFCFICNLMFGDKECLYKHNHDKHQEVNDKYECIECRELFSNTKDLIDHLTRRHRNGESFLCRYCKPEKAFVSVHSLINHVNDGHKIEKPHRCHLCGLRFLKDLELIKHSKLHQGKSFECPICHNLFSQKGNLETHIRTHTGEKPFKCEEPNCGKGFSDHSTFYRHRLVHTKEKPYQCVFCLRGFSQISNLKVHKKNRHPNGLYECEFCQKQFKDRNELENHSSKQHTDDRQYTCRVCLKKFKQWANLKNHMTSSHTDKSVSHICEYCNQSFESQTDLQTHKEVHVGKENPYICNICQRTFRNSSNLKKHIKIHFCEKSHICRTCDKKFSFLSGLKNHQLTHEVDKPHKCNTCTKSFISKYLLKRHITLHNGEKPYSCSVCPEKFSYSTSLKRHIQTHNKKTSIISTPKCPESFKTNARNEYRTPTNFQLPSRQPDEFNFICKICNSRFKTLDEKNNHQVNHICADDGDDYYTLDDPREDLVPDSKEGETCDNCHITFETGRKFKEHLVQCVPLKQNCYIEEYFVQQDENEMMVMEIEEVRL